MSSDEENENSNSEGAAAATAATTTTTTTVNSQRIGSGGMWGGLFSTAAAGFPVDARRQDLSLKAMNVLSRSLACAVERGMSEIQAGYQCSLADMDKWYADTLAVREREISASQMKITPAKLGELQAAFTEQVESKFREKEISIVEPLRKRVAELEAQCQAAAREIQAAVDAAVEAETKKRKLEVDAAGVPLRKRIADLEAKLAATASMRTPARVAPSLPLPPQARAAAAPKPKAAAHRLRYSSTLEDLLRAHRLSG